MWRIHESLKYESKREVLDSIYRTYIAKQLCLKTILQLSIFIYIEMTHYSSLPIFDLNDLAKPRFASSWLDVSILWVVWLVLIDHCTFYHSWVYVLWLWLVAIWLCKSFHIFGWIELQLNEIKAKHSQWELYQFIWD